MGECQCCSAGRLRSHQGKAGVWHMPPALLSRVHAACALQQAVQRLPVVAASAAGAPAAAPAAAARAPAPAAAAAAAPRVPPPRAPRVAAPPVAAAAAAAASGRGGCGVRHCNGPRGLHVSIKRTAYQAGFMHTARPDSPARAAAGGAFRARRRPAGRPGWEGVRSRLGRRSVNVPPVTTAWKVSLQTEPVQSPSQLSKRANGKTAHRLRLRSPSRGGERAGDRDGERDRERPCNSGGASA